jgi:hypothetical protein
VRIQLGPEMVVAVAVPVWVCPVTLPRRRR